MTLTSELRAIHNGTSKLPLADSGEIGGYVVSESVLNFYRHAESYWRRKDKKKLRRWQHQKRKQ